MTVTAPAPDGGVLVPPAYLSLPPRLGSYGDEAVDMMRAAGMDPDPEQCLSIDAMLSYGPGGKPAALETCRIEARQNGKTTKELIPVVAFDLFTGEPDRLIWTAHLFKTCRDAFADFVRLIDGADFLTKRVKKIAYANGEESIELMNGAKLEFLARSKGGGRGLGGRKLVFDEALVLSTESMGALIPTLSARRGWAQIHYASSAARGDSTQLRSLVKRGRAGGDPSLVYIEHCAPGGWDDPGCELGKDCRHDVRTRGCALDREDLWLLANHGMARGRLTAETIRSERRALAAAPLEFGRERLGWHEADENADPDRIPEALWRACADPDSRIPDDEPVVFAVDSSPGGASTAIAVAGRRVDGKIHVDIVDYRRGTDWVVDRLQQLSVTHEQVIGAVWKPSDPIGALSPRIEAAGLWMTPMTAQEMGEACGVLKAEIEDDRLRHGGARTEKDVPSVLDDAFASAERRVGVEGVWTWGRRVSTGDICALVAATEAVWGLISAGEGDPQVLAF